MENRRLLLIFFGIFYFSLVVIAFSEEYLFIQPFRAKIYAKPSITAEVLGTVDSGFQFLSAGNEGRWVKLLFKGTQGFIPAVQASKNPPLGKSVVKTAEAAPKLSARSRASASTAVVAGMKGLTYEDRARISQGERCDFEALDKVDSLKISPEELNQFELEGGKQ